MMKRFGRIWRARRLQPEQEAQASNGAPMFDACALPRNYLGRMHVLMLFFMLAVGASGALSIDSPGEAMQDDDDSVWCWLFLATAISCGCRFSLLARNISSRGRLSYDPQRHCAWLSGQRRRSSKSDSCRAISAPSHSSMGISMI